jgi:hypothetical protein
VDWVARTKGGAVMLERSPRMVAMDCNRLRVSSRCFVEKRTG